MFQHPPLILTLCSQNKNEALETMDQVTSYNFITPYNQIKEENLMGIKPPLKNGNEVK